VAIFIGRAIVSQTNFYLSEKPSNRIAELMRSVAGEIMQPLSRILLPPQQVIECVCQCGDFVLMSRLRQAGVRIISGNASRLNGHS
jgi:hypothetical protein